MSGYGHRKIGKVYNLKNARDGEFLGQKMSVEMATFQLECSLKIPFLNFSGNFLELFSRHLKHCLILTVLNPKLDYLNPSLQN